MNTATSSISFEKLNLIATLSSILAGVYFTVVSVLF